MSNKQTFGFHLDQKVITWYRTTYYIDADSKDEAEALAIQMHEDGELESLDWHKISGLEQIVLVADNGGEATEEIISEDNELIYSNKS